MNWYEATNINEVDSPALLIYPDRVAQNIATMIKWVGGDASRLVPHVKTHKTSEIIQMQLAAGIERFKCATIAELEMCLTAGANWVLMTYQLTGPKIDRFIRLVQLFPNARISSLVDNLQSAKVLAAAFEKQGLKGETYLDINNGFNRTGLLLDEYTFPVYQEISAIKSLELKGLHIYDGHIRNNEVEQRTQQSNQFFEPVYSLMGQITAAGFPEPEIITGGSPTFTPAAMRKNFYCSPGTTLLWDWGYSKTVPELPVQWAAVLLTRIISKPKPGYITTDLGHKSVGSENPIDKRVLFLNLSDYTIKMQSEEHLVAEVKDWDKLEVGDVLYGIPYHVCPTVALYDTANIIRDNKWVEDWSVIARKRKITI
ncbi:D-TA family PLP-dependent enzyme [Flavihumibacter profundi]|uniref:D-TA family PLP-dependent enzyme n=1 Tax=Flavihumibacter profundi TaxID=2716883 RepID=UPI001CC60CE1|nr:D-TA family PLP-dependent enzyme [Flavihumibacter profundi]MBZ5856612.1 D-TA family PLP-dependent enzyme [Flavihumibacter profundi]